MSVQQIRDYYGVPAKVRGRVQYTHGPDESYFGTITGTRGSYLLIRLDHQVQSSPYHPTWKLYYLDAGHPAS